MEKEKEREGEYFGGFKWCSIFSFKIFFDNRVCIDKKLRENIRKLKIECGIYIFDFGNMKS